MVSGEAKLYSMTGYGTSEEEVDGCRVIAEIKALNSRYLEPKFRLPRGFEHMENVLRKSLREKVSRGKIDVWIYIKTDEKFELESLMKYIKLYGDFLGKVKNELGLEFSPVLSDVLAMKNLVGSERVEYSDVIPEAKIVDVFEAALEAFEHSRLTDGLQSRLEIENYVSRIYETIERMQKSIQDVVNNYKDQLRSRIKELIGEGYDETRIIMEAGIYAAKVDIDEELSRLGAHAGRLQSVLRSGSPCGKELDFIVQEMMREINTIGSKVQDSIISNEVIDTKVLIEKIKEQVRNIE
ncbi:MAG: YicC family protein [Spirochaetes bacterium]|nr:MAG: YicC family protein [Spirochaetota bacterium]